MQQSQNISDIDDKLVQLQKEIQQLDQQYGFSQKQSHPQYQHPLTQSQLQSSQTHNNNNNDYDYDYDYGDDNDNDDGNDYCQQKPSGHQQLRYKDLPQINNVDNIMTTNIQPKPQINNKWKKLFPYGPSTQQYYDLFMDSIKIDCDIKMVDNQFQQIDSQCLLDQYVKDQSFQ